MVFTCGIALTVGITRASRSLHSHLLYTILRCPGAFFDVTPLGRILNRFGKDIDTIDMAVPEGIKWSLMMLCEAVSIVFVVAISTPFFLTAFGPLLLIYALIQVLYRIGISIISNGIGMFYFS